MFLRAGRRFGGRFLQLANNLQLVLIGVFKRAAFGSLFGFAVDSWHETAVSLFPSAFPAGNGLKISLALCKSSGKNPAICEEGAWYGDV